MTDGKPTFAVLGTGNSGQTYAADITLKGYDVNLAELPAFAENLTAIKETGGIDLSGEAGSGFARLNMITTDLGEAIKGVNVIIIGGSAFAHEPICKALMDRFEDGQYILFTSNFGALRFRRWMEAARSTVDVIPVETASLLYATRAIAPGTVACIGIKESLPTAALPASRTQDFLKMVHPVFPQFTAAPIFGHTSIGNLNPIAHPPMILFNAGRIEATGGKGWNLYAEGATESVTRVMVALDHERMALLERIGMKPLSFEEALVRLYASYGLGRKSLSDTLRKSPIHSNPVMEAPERIDTRYLSEDVPFGLATWSMLGRLWGVKTPSIDATLTIASVMLERDCFADGLSAEDLGIYHLQPETVCAFVE